MSGRTRARLAALPTGQRRLVLLGLGLIVFIGIVNPSGPVVAFVRAELRPPTPLLLAIPAYPGATAELRVDRANPFVTSQQYQATTTDDVDTVWRWYKIRFPEGGWMPGKYFSTFVRDGCPGGSVEVMLGPASGRGTMITVEMRHTGTLISRLPLCQR
jgi:hypothetical protein